MIFTMHMVDCFLFELILMTNLLHLFEMCNLWFLVSFVNLSWNSSLIHDNSCPIDESFVTQEAV